MKNLAAYATHKDEELVSVIKTGDKLALEVLIQRNRPYIYNIAWKMVHNTQDAEDVTQEVLVKVITKLDGFQGKSAFRTWLYRITINHLLKMKQRGMEHRFMSFDQHAQGLENIPEQEMSEAEQWEHKEHIEDMRIRCMSGMLLCLNREQRILYIMGEMLGIDSKQGGEIFEISPENYRQRLSRARKELHNYTTRKCGLVNKDNPCRCHKKAKTLLQQGYLDHCGIEFNIETRKKFHDMAVNRITRLVPTLEEKYDELFAAHPYREHFETDLVKELFKDSEIQQLFNLN